MIVKTLSKCIREYKKESILTPVYMAGEVFMEVAITYVLSLLIDRGITPGNMGEILRIGGLLILCALVSLAFGVMSGRSAAVASTGFAKNVRQDMYYNIQTFSFANIDKFSTASLITRLTTDVTRMQQAYMMLIRIAIRSPLMLIFSLIMSFRINARIATVFLCAVPVLGLGIYIMMSKAHPIYERVFKTYDELNRVVQENLRGIRVVKAFVREDHEREKFGKVSDTIYRDFSRAEKITTFGSPLMQASVYTCILLSSWLGAHIIVAGSMTTGQLMSVLTYAMSILSSLMMLSMVLMMLIISRASAERICEVLNERTDIANAPGAETVIPDGSVDFDGVSFSYGGRGGRGGRSCLENIDLHIRSGETIGLIGGTGSGKSTLVQLIPRLYDVTEGCVRVGGRDVREYDIETLRNAVSMVLQKNELFSGTIKDNLRWGNEHATDAEIMEACRLAQADPFIQDFPDKYDTWIEQGGTNVSGGQKQRLCIARALLKKPKILILDDSTSAVDTRTDALIREGFRSYIPDTTKIIIAQRVASVQDADMIVVLDNGRIADCGTHEELLARCEIYREVYQSQTKGGEDNE